MQSNPQLPGNYLFQQKPSEVLPLRENNGLLIRKNLKGPQSIVQVEFFYFSLVLYLSLFEYRTYNKKVQFIIG